ncbi:MAG: tRNA 2-selenouridine(34) synthase MnmH [Peptococcaceae bacterium]|jgi:tRNA 2-selenouridine synthase|nr:tRNA 2-selenouridine(34) synthase MnmH [Peptococcaceae bacterium]
MVDVITIENALGIKDALWIDVRSEGEFAEATIPGAINVPVFENEERAAIGTLYHKAGPDPARRLALKLIAPKLPEIVSKVDQIAKDKKLVVFCWRGGQRSEFMAGLFDTMGYSVYRVLGGYKSYRRYVNKYLDRQELTQKAIVLYGLTGVGKTEALRELAKRGMPALDLEGLAMHRGSVYGKIGLPPSPSQKAFEGYLVEFFTAIGDNSYFIVECESRRIGNLLVPPPVMASMAEGSKILLYAPIEERVKRIRAVYTEGPDHNIKELQAATGALVKRLGRNKVAALNHMLDSGDFEPVITYLLQKYYDPCYKYPQEPDDKYDLCVDTTDMHRAIDKIVEFIKTLETYHRE